MADRLPVAFHEEALDQRSIDRIVLGGHSLRAAVVFDLRRIAHGDCDPGLLQGQAHRETIRTGRLANQVNRARLLTDLGDAPQAIRA